MRSNIQISVKDGGLVIEVPSNLKPGEYTLASNKENNSDVYAFYYAVPVSILLAYAEKKGKKIDGKPATKEHMDAYITNKLIKSFDKCDYSFVADIEFRPVITKRDLTREQLIDFVNLACSFVGGKTGDQLPLWDQK